MLGHLLKGDLCGLRGARSYTWVKQRLQEAALVPKAPGRGKHRSPA